MSSQLRIQRLTGAASCLDSGMLVVWIGGWPVTCTNSPFGCMKMLVPSGLGLIANGAFAVVLKNQTVEQSHMLKSYQLNSQFGT